MNSSIDVSFITINYNSSEHTIKLVDSIIKNSLDISYEIIIIDNASEDIDLLNLKSFINNIEKIKLIINRINSGFSSGNMLGVNYAKGKYWFFINNDTILLNNVAKILKDFLDNNKDIAVFISSYGHFPYILKQFFGSTTHRFFSKQKFPSNKIKLTKPSIVEVISGSCMFFKAEDFCSIGGFDTIFFLYCEEEDICKRVWDYGKKVYCVPEAEIFHKEGGSTEKTFEIQREFYISYYHLIEKHYNIFGQLLLKLALFIKLFFKIFKHKNSLQIFLSMIIGFSNKNSMRYKQKIRRA